MSLGEILGRRRRAMNWSQENCLIDNHRLTCERWGWGFIDTWCMKWLICYAQQIQLFYREDNELFSYVGRAFLIALILICRKVFLSGQCLGRRNAHTFHSVLWNSCDHGVAVELHSGSDCGRSEPSLSNNCWRSVAIQADSFIITLFMGRQSVFFADCFFLTVWSGIENLF